MTSTLRASALVLGLVIASATVPGMVQLVGAQRLPPAQRPGSAWPGDVNRDRVLELIRDCEKRTDRFRRTFRRALGNSVLDGRPAADVLNDRARRLERALDRVKKAAGRRRFEETRSGVRDALDAGRDINRAVRAVRLRSDAEREWAVLRGQLDALARIYRLPGLR